MSDGDVLPLFVLPMVILPGEVQQLRIFEPRYRQMLDDCLLDGKPFGLVCDDDEETFNGWNGPRAFGCEAEIIHHETMGSNHFVEIVGTRKFEIKKVLEPALPPFSDESMAELMPEVGIYPDLDTILEKIPEDNEYNYLDIKNWDWVFNNYKTKKTYKQVKMPVPEDLVKLLKVYFQYHPHAKAMKQKLYTSYDKTFAKAINKL